MIRVGDKAGSVEQIFPRLSAYLKDQKKLRDKVSAALAYPVLVLILAIAGSAGLILFVLPKMETIFGSFGGNSAEQIHRNIDTIKTLMLCFLCALGIGIIGVIVLKRLSAVHKELARTLDYQLLRLPLAGAFLSSWESLNFSFAMEVLTGGGVPVEAALPEAEAVVSNRAYRRALREVRTSVINGGNLSRAFGEQKIFPPYLSRWIAIGESSGRTEKIFSQVRSYFQEEIDKRTGQFLLLIEPVLIVAIGIVILCLVTGIILPLFSVYGNLL
jgi:type II secretory pathway component PulF